MPHPGTTHNTETSGDLQAMQDLENILPLFKAIVSHMDDGVLISDRSGKVLYQNFSAELFLTDDTDSSRKSIKNIRNISSIDLISIMKEAFYEDMLSPSSRTTTILKTFQRTIQHKNRAIHLEIQCCLSCAFNGQLRLVHPARHIQRAPAGCYSGPCHQ